MVFRNELVHTTAIGCAPLSQARHHALQCAFGRVSCSAASDSASAGKSSVENSMPFSYQSSDGRRKASLEDALSKDAKNRNRSVLMNEQPWKVGWQVSERNLLWNNDVAAGLVKVGPFVSMHLKWPSLPESQVIKPRH